MSEAERGVGVNAEPDDFAARYDRMVVGGGASWVFRIVLAALGSLAVIALLNRLITA